MAQLAVRVDTNSCIASATCTSIAPELFALADAGDHAIALQPAVTDPRLIPLVQEAERSCPTAAIIVERS